MAREVSARRITAAVRELFLQAAVLLPPDVEEALEAGSQNEQSEWGRYVFAQIRGNSVLARKESVPLCQDTGAAIVFVEVGQGVSVVDGPLEDAIQQGVRDAYREGFLRRSICDPLSRRNTGDNTPAFVHYEIVAGETLKITAMPKGGGAENASLITMLTPAAGLAGIKSLVLEHIGRVGKNACPPLIIGIGIGATLDVVGVLAKKALLRPVGSANLLPDLAELEAELLHNINALGIGPGGYGGTVSALAVHVATSPCHIASLPVAINVQCHSARRREAVL